MEKYTGRNINAKQILILGDLEIRDVADKNPRLSAREYLSKVEEFIIEGSKFYEVFNDIAELVKTSEALKGVGAKFGIENQAIDLTKGGTLQSDLDKIKKLLTTIGYTKFNDSIDMIYKSVANNELSLAGNLSDEIRNNFSILHSKTRSTMTAKPVLAELQEGEKDPTLKEYLEILHQQENDRKLRVLAVDDVIVVLNNIISILKPHYDVFALKNSSQVEGFLEHTTPELFLLDIEMPYISGFELVSIIRNNPRHRDTPIIFLTGSASSENLKKAISQGACDFVVKPVEQKVLLEKIATHITKKKDF